MKIFILAICVAMAAADKIIGGEPATKGEAPYIVNLKLNGNFRCGGSIYSAGWAVSAAHCYAGSGTLTITAGDHFINDIEGTEQNIIVSEQIRHRRYSSSTLENDIMLLRLQSDLDFSSVFVRPALLPAAGVSPEVGEYCKVIGWGNTQVIGTNLPNELNKVEVPVISNADCNAQYGGDIYDGMICLGLVGTGGKDACQGDSGGPVECHGELHGITSWGIGCARPDYPGVYTRVASYINWMAANAQ